MLFAVWAERRARQRRRRFQRLGRTTPPDARSRRQRHLGTLHPDLVRDTSTSTRSATATAGKSCSRPIPMVNTTNCGRAPDRSFLHVHPMPGAASGWRNGRTTTGNTGPMRRFTRHISARGSAIPREVMGLPGEAAHRSVEYVKDMGLTHRTAADHRTPTTSWGYQVLQV